MKACWSGRSCSGPTSPARSRVLVSELTTSIGIESWKAPAMGVAAFATPAPVISTQTPGLPAMRE